ncbi:MAG: HlyD family type I secretion periplasmic adaptor subunit [Desulfuromonadaceae bacterium]
MTTKVPPPVETDIETAPQVDIMTKAEEKSLAKAQKHALTTTRVKTLTHDSQLRESSISSLPATMYGLAVLAMFFASVVLWMVFVPLKTVIMSQGEVVFKNKRQAVQHLEGGIVKSILVKDGDMVQAGQPLIELESKQIQPVVNMIQEQNLAEIAQMARVEAESKDLKSIPFPQSLTARSKDSSVGRILDSEERLFYARRDAAQHQIELLRLQIAQLIESSKGSQERLTAKNQEIAIIKEQLAGNQSLLKEGYVTETIVTDQQRLLLGLTGERDMLVASIASEKQRLAELEQRILAFKADRVQGAITEMKQSGLRRIDLEERIRPMRDTLDRQVIRAPVTGKVVGLKVTTVGGVLVGRDTLMEIAPTGDNLILEGKIMLEDISRISVGMPAIATISGFDGRTTPILTAKITYISDDRLMVNGPQGPQANYIAHFELDPESLKFLEERQLTLLPGMSASLTIAVKPRTPFDAVYAKFKKLFEKANRSH